MSELTNTIVKAARELVSVIEANAPETDCSLFPRKLKELVNSTISAQSSSLVTVTANDIAPKLNIAADALACAHGMYTVGDKTNALRMVMAAFESPDCVPLMISLSELNEETDPSDFNTVVSRINKGEEHNRDVLDTDDDEILYGDNVEPEQVAPPSAQEDALVGNPAAEINAIQDQDLNNPNSGAPYGDFADYDFLNQGVPPDTDRVLKDVLSTKFDPSANDWEKVLGESLGQGATGYLFDNEQDLGTDDYGSDANKTDSGYTDNWSFEPTASDHGDDDEESDNNDYDADWDVESTDASDVADVVPGYDDNQLSNVSTDPATDVEWNPANWDINDDMPTRSDPMNMDFDDMAAVNPSMTDLNGIDNTAMNKPNNESDTAGLDSNLGLIPGLNPTQEIIAKIKDKRVLAAINILSSVPDKKSKSKLNAFINVYCSANNIR